MNSEVNVIVYGSVFLDIVVHYEHEYLFAGNSVYRGYTCFGGGGANIAYYLSALGVKSGVVALLGSDPLGRILLRHLEENGVDFYGEVVEGSSNAIIVLLHPGGERSFLVVMRENRGLEEHSALRPLFEKKPKAVVVHGYWLDAPGLREIVPLVVREAKRSGVLVFFDPGAYNIVEKNRELILREILPWTSVFLPNIRELATLVGQEDWKRGARSLLGAGVDTVVVKLGARGAFAVSASGVEVYEPSLEARSVSTIGAGDAFDAGMVYGVLEELELREALKIANALASSVTECVCSQCEEAKRRAKELSRASRHFRSRRALEG